jgi:hypothetical protein
MLHLWRSLDWETVSVRYAFGLCAKMKQGTFSALLPRNTLMPHRAQGLVRDVWSFV